MVLFVSVCLFFNSSRSFNWFLHFLHFVFSVLILFTIILNSFSGSLPISPSFIWTSVILVCSFISVLFLCLFINIIIILTYCVWVLLFPVFKVEFFPSWFLPSWGWSSVMYKLHIGWDLCWVLVCLFVFLLMCKAEWGVNPVCWWLGLCFCFACYLDDILHRVLLVVGWCGFYIQVVSFV